MWRDGENMRFYVKYIKSEEKRVERLARVTFVLLFFLCLAIDSFYNGAELPEFFYKLHYNY